MKLDLFSSELKDNSVENNDNLTMDFDPSFKIDEVEGNGFDESIEFDPDERIECLNFEDCIMMFEQSQWDSLDAFEIDEAISNLKDIIVLNLGLENVPEIGYYFEDNECDYGSFSPADNKIYLNCFQLDFPEKLQKHLLMN